MTALAADRNTKRRDAEIANYPVAASATIYAGSMVCVKDDGYVTPAANTAGYIFVGIAEEQVDNSSGSDGDLTVNVRRVGAYNLVSSGLAITDEGSAVYVTDDQTVSTTPANVYCGHILDYVSATEAWVDISAATRPASYTSGALSLTGALTLGVDGTGVDARLYGDTAGESVLWDMSDDQLELTDGVAISFGDSDDAEIQFNTGQTQDALYIGVDSTSRTLLVMDKADKATDLALGAQTYPAVVVADAAATGYAMLSHSADGVALVKGNNDIGLRAGSAASDVLLLEAYDVDGSTWDDIITITAGNTPTLALAADGGITISNAVSVANTMDITAATSGGSDLGSTSGEWGDIYVGDAKSVQFGADQDVKLLHDNSDGLNIGSANSEKIGLWGATPATQSAHVADTYTAATQATTTEIVAIGTTINSILTVLETLGATAAA